MSDKEQQPAAQQAQQQAQQQRPRVLISNDDGINAPGLRALVQALAAAGTCAVYVCAPSGERSAQSHAITLGRYLSCFLSEVPGAVQAYAVDGTPADSVMLALNSDVFGGLEFDLVASGINRGDNNGLHVIYSGTVGAAREAACKGMPAIALSLADHGAKQQDDYDTPAAVAVALIEAALESIASGAHGGEHWAAGTVINVNFPCRQLMAAGGLKGIALTHQGSGCVFPAFKEIAEASGPHLPEIDEHTPNLRVFRNYAGWARHDESEGSDSWATHEGYVSVTPLSLRSDVAPRLGQACPAARAAHAAVSHIVEAAAARAKLPTHGVLRL